MTKHKLLLDDFKKLYKRYERKIEDNLKTVDIEYAEKVYLNLCKNNKNFRKMLDACEKREMREHEVLEIVLFHSYCLSSNSILNTV